MKLIFDIESNGLLDTISKIHCLVAIDIDTLDEYVFRPGDNSWMELFDKATVIAGHNIINYDLPAVKKITGWTPKPDTKIIDTMIMSQLNRYTRNGGHSLKNLAKLAGEEQKIDYNGGWEDFSEEMLEYCIMDVKSNLSVYRKLITESAGISNNTKGLYRKSLRMEHEFSQLSSAMTENGWKIDLKACNKLLKKINVQMAQIELEVEPMLKDREIILDKEPRKSVVLKNGKYDITTRRYFNLEYPSDGSVPDRYTRVKKMTSDLGNNAQVIELLYQEGWIPTEFNWKKEGRDFIKGSPKLTEDSFESIKGDLGRLVAKWRMLRSRRGVMEGFQKNERNGRLHCEQFCIGTHSGRGRHKIIVNIPGAFAPLGTEIRKMFITDKEKVIVGADSSANQLRGIAYYMGDEDFTESAVNGNSEDGTDIHTRNAEILGIPRNLAKNFYYALVFGAGQRKLGETVGKSQAEGKRLKALFFEGMPAYERMLNRVNAQWDHNGGFIYGLDGRRIFCERFKALNNLLQVYEAVTCRSAYNLMWKTIQERNIDAKPVLVYHDEIEFECNKDQAQELSILMEEAFHEAPKEFGVDIMAGESKIGKDWYEVH